MSTPYPFLPDPGNPATVAQRLIDSLTRAYRELRAAQQDVLDSLAESQAKNLTLARLQVFLNEVEHFQTAVEQSAATFVRNDLPALYAAAAQAALSGPFVWTSLHVEAVTALATDMYRDVLRASQEAGRTSASFARAVRTVARQHIPLAATTARTPVQVGRELADSLASRYSIDAVTYRNGAVHSAEDYATMLARTKTAVAYNHAGLNRWHEADIGWVEVFDGADCGWVEHEDGDKANASFRTVAQALSHPISHPNCRRSFGGRPDIRSRTDAESAPPSTTPAQRADQAQAEQDQAVARTAERRRQARASRRAERAAS